MMRGEIDIEVLDDGTECETDFEIGGTLIFTDPREYIRRFEEDFEARLRRDEANARRAKLQAQEQIDKRWRQYLRWSWLHEGLGIDTHRVARYAEFYESSDRHISESRVRRTLEWGKKERVKRAKKHGFQDVDEVEQAWFRHTAMTERGEH